MLFVPSAGSAALGPTVAEVDLDALRHNVAVLADEAGGPERLIGVVKADAYGHGAIPVARVLTEAGVERLAVATVPEALRLRAEGFDQPILVFAGPLPETLPAYAAGDLQVTVPSPAVAEAVVALAETLGRPLAVHVKVDTGMGRLGMTEAEAVAATRRLAAARGVRVAGLWTHFSSPSVPGAEEALRQWDRFEAVVAEVGHLAETLHAASSGALFNVPPSVRAHPNLLVRTGIALYVPFERPHLAAQAALRPLMRLTARITHLKTVPAGTPISYGGTWKAPRETRIATIGAGYADGYPRMLSNRAEVGIGGRRYPVVGTVCMDMFMVDIGPGGHGAPVALGDEVVLFGSGGPTVTEVAAWAQTIPYEICCGIAARVHRQYPRTDEQVP